jgi:hypothetical protein
LYAFSYLFGDVELVEVEWVCTDEGGFGEAFGLVVDGDDTLGTAEEGGVGGEEADRAAAPHDYGRAGLNLTQLCAVVTLRERKKR